MSRRRILVVDDEPGMLRAVERILRRNYEVSCADTPAEALDSLDDFGPDLAILDIRMPEVDGFELMTELQNRRPDLQVILMTGSLTEFDQKLIRAIRQRAFYFIQKPFDRDVLLALVERALELRRLSELDRRHTRRLERELEQARLFQKSLMPPPVAEFGDVRLAARYLPSDELCGDLYSWAEGTDGSVAFLVADVSGHGASAAMLTGFAKSAFHSSWAEGFEPEAVVRALIAGMKGLQGNRFITLFCGRLHPSHGHLEYVNAGHPPGLLRRRDGVVEHLTSTGMLISPVLPHLRFEQRRVAFGPGDLLLTYSDGVIEAMGDLDGEAVEFGVERLEAAVTAASDTRCLDTVADHLERHLGGRRLDDDVTLLGLQLRERGGQVDSEA